MTMVKAMPMRRGQIDRQAHTSCPTYNFCDTRQLMAETGDAAAAQGQWQYRPSWPHAFIVQSLPDTCPIVARGAHRAPADCSIRTALHLQVLQT